jgi:hypothetical protein
VFVVKGIAAFGLILSIRDIYLLKSKKELKIIQIIRIKTGKEINIAEGIDILYNL